jgi:cell division protein FtsB
VTDGNGDREALDTAQGLTRAVGSLSAEVKRLRTYGRRNRAYVLVDVALTVLLAVFGAVSVHAANQAADASTAANQTRVSSISACQAGNVTRAQEVMLWTHLAQISKPPPHETPVQKAKDLRQIDVLLAYIRHVFAKRDCEKVYATSGPGK